MSEENLTDEAPEVPAADPTLPATENVDSRIAGFLGFFQRGIDQGVDLLDQLFGAFGEAVQVASDTAAKVQEARIHAEAQIQEAEAALAAAAERHAASTEGDPRIVQIQAILNQKIADNSKVEQIRQLLG